jgi:hypothetical protein
LIGCRGGAVEEYSERLSESGVQFSLVGDVLIECCSESLSRIARKYFFGFDGDFCGVVVVVGRCAGFAAFARAGFAGRRGIRRGHRRNIELLENLDRYSNVEAAVQQLLG